MEGASRRRGGVLGPAAAVLAVVLLSGAARGFTLGPETAVSPLLPAAPGNFAYHAVFERVPSYLAVPVPGGQLLVYGDGRRQPFASGTVTDVHAVVLDASGTATMPSDRRIVTGEQLLGAANLGAEHWILTQAPGSTTTLRQLDDTGAPTGVTLDGTGAIGLTCNATACFAWSESAILRFGPGGALLSAPGGDPITLSNLATSTYAPAAAASASSFVIVYVANSPYDHALAQQFSLDGKPMGQPADLGTFAYELRAVSSGVGFTILADSTIVQMSETGAVTLGAIPSLPDLAVSGSSVLVGYGIPGSLSSTAAVAPVLADGTLGQPTLGALPGDYPGPRLTCSPSGCLLVSAGNVQPLDASGAISGSGRPFQTYQTSPMALATVLKTQSAIAIANNGTSVTLLDLQGQPMGTATLTAQPGALATSGADVLEITSDADGASIDVQRYDATLHPVGAPVVVDIGSTSPGLGWDGYGFVASWSVPEMYTGNQLPVAIHLGADGSLLDPGPVSLFSNGSPLGGEYVSQFHSTNGADLYTYYYLGLQTVVTDAHFGVAAQFTSDLSFVPAGDRFLALGEGQLVSAALSGVVQAPAPFQTGSAADDGAGIVELGSDAGGLEAFRADPTTLASQGAQVTVAMGPADAPLVPAWYAVPTSKGAVVVLYQKYDETAEAGRLFSRTLAVGALQGSTCSTAADCASGYCTGGICCNAACDAGCQTCAQAMGAPTDGVCTAIPVSLAFVCRPSSGPCDSAELCNGAATCPNDVHLPDGAGCFDGNPCTEQDHCEAGQCVGLPVSCDDDDACTTDTCDPASGCQHPPVADGTTCDDGVSCNAGDHCASGVCVPTTGPDCSDGNPCTEDTCDGNGGCIHTPKEDGTGRSDGTPARSRTSAPRASACPARSSRATTATLARRTRVRRTGYPHPGHVRRVREGWTGRERHRERVDRCGRRWKRRRERRLRRRRGRDVERSRQGVLVRDLAPTATSHTPPRSSRSPRSRWRGAADRVDTRAACGSRVMGARSRAHRGTAHPSGLERRGAGDLRPAREEGEGREAALRGGGHAFQAPRDAAPGVTARHSPCRSQPGPWARRHRGWHVPVRQTVRLPGTRTSV